MRKFTAMTMLCLVAAMCILSFISFDAQAVENSGSNMVTDDYSFSLDIKKDNELKWDWTSDHNLSFSILYTGTPSTLVAQTANSMDDSGGIITTGSGKYLVEWTNANSSVPVKLTYKITYTQAGDKAVDACCGGLLVIPLFLICPVLLLRRRN